MANLKSSVGEKEAAAIRKKLAQWARQTNPACADCGRANPTWASVNLGVLVCLECAGRHRHLGTHITKMRSITLDTVLPEEARFLINMSNARANQWWEARLPPEQAGAAKASPSFIESKYSLKKWALEDAGTPAPSRDSVPDSHPWWTGSQAAAAPLPSPAPVPAPTATPILSSTRMPPQSVTAPTHQPSLIDLGGSSPIATAAAAAAAPAAAIAADPFGSTGDPFAAASSSGPAPSPALSAAAPTQPPRPPATNAAGAADPFASTCWPAAQPAGIAASRPSASASPAPTPHGTPPPGPRLMPQGTPPPATLASTAAPPPPARSRSKADLNAHILSLYNAPSPGGSQNGTIPFMTPSASQAAQPWQAQAPR